MKTDRRQLSLFLLTHLAVAGGAALFLFLDRYAVFDLILICPLHLIGLYCPTCGMTRAVHSLLALDPVASLTYHPLLLPLAAVALYYDSLWLASVIKGSRAPLRRASRIPLLLAAALLLAWFLLRNLLLALGIDPLGDFLP